MKKFICFMLMMIGMVLMSTGLTSCHDHHSSPSRFSKKDSIAIARIAAQEQASSFSTKDMNEFLVYIVAKRDQHSCDSIVFHLPDRILAGISNTLLAKGISLSTETVADEYLSKRAFYDGMIRFEDMPEYRAIERRSPKSSDTINLKEEDL